MKNELLSILLYIFVVLMKKQFIFKFYISLIKSLIIVKNYYSRK